MQKVFEQPECKKPAIWYQDDALMLIYKPRYLHTVKQNNEDNSLELWLDSCQNVQKKIPENGLVQRLDFDTAGLILVAKTQESYNHLKEMSKFSKIKKEYLAMSSMANSYYCPMGFTQSSWDAQRKQEPWQVAVEAKFVYQSAGRKAVRLVSATSQSKHASAVYETQVEIIKKVPHQGYLLQATLSKGYRHQVRATLAGLGFPIVGDELYGGQPQASMAFWATSVQLKHPVYQQEIRFLWSIKV
jgi:23S rRNA pseudouridine1911/1915/1917 synthase